MTALTAYHRMTDTLAKTYGDILFTRHGVRHPVTFYPAPDHQIHDVDSALGRLINDLTGADDMAIYDRGYLQTMQNAGRNFFNGTTFIMTRLRTSPLCLDGALGKYFDMMATCGALERELREAADSSFIRLPNRAQLHRHIPAEQALIDGRGRSATIGVATLVVFNDSGVYKALLGRRSSKAATDPLFYHLMPAFIFQPSSETLRFQEEWSVSHQIYRELLEELFGLPEVANPDQYNYFDDHPALIYLKNLIAEGKAGLYLTGIVMNLLTLRPEITSLLLIHDPDWYRRVTAPNSDIPLQLAIETHKEQVLYTPIDTDEHLLEPLPEHSYLMMPPQAIAGLWAGVDLARTIVKGP